MKEYVIFVTDRELYGMRYWSTRERGGTVVKTAQQWWEVWLAMPTNTRWEDLVEAIREEQRKECVRVFRIGWTAGDTVDDLEKAILAERNMEEEA